jgi:hypothetical protein
LREQAQTPAAQVGLVLEDLADLFDTTVPWLQDVGNALSDESVVMVDGRGLVSFFFLRRQDLKVTYANDFIF